MKGGRCGGTEEVEKGRESRISKDREVNGEGRRLCSFLGERGWGIMNGNVEGVEGGEWTYTGGRGNSVIDYVLGNEDTRERRGENGSGSKAVELGPSPSGSVVEGGVQGGVGKGKKGGGEGQQEEIGQRRGERSL